LELPAIWNSLQSCLTASQVVYPAGIKPQPSRQTVKDPEEATDFHRKKEKKKKKEKKEETGL